ncbi:hypothetical protein EAF04_006186 [Stromatinia cepivora]|nr:hypothetical protein EAF04_006186 [Stromatinia cepivora]
MSETEGDVPFLLRDRRIKAVRDRFHRPPTASELRAIDALPLEPRKNLNDTSPNGQKIYDLLKAFEKSGYVEGLEEAGRLLWAQVFAKPDFSQIPRREPISITRDIATSGYAEVRYMASQKPAQQSAAEKVLSTNTTSNAFAGSPQKSWMTKGVSVSPSPRRASISSTENDKNNEPATYDFQTQFIPPPIPLRLAPSGQQTQNHASTFVNQVPGASPNIYKSGVYTPWPLHSSSQEHQYASPYSIQASTNSMSSVLERRDPTRDPISRPNYTLNEYKPSMVNSYDPTKSHYFATLGTGRHDPNPLSYSTPQHSPPGYPNSGMSSPDKNHAYPAPSMRQDSILPSNTTVYSNYAMADSNRTPYDPSTPPFHPAISSQAQQLFFSRQEEERDELARITSNIHESLSNLPDSYENQQVASSSRMAAANTLANMANTDRTAQLITPSASTYQSPSSSAPSVTPGQSSNNPFVIRDNMGFIHSQDLTYQVPNPTPTNPQSTTPDRNSTSSFTNLTATVPNPPQSTTKKARTPLPNAPRPQFGKLIPENPVSGTIFSTNTKHDLLVSKAKKESIQKALVPLPPAFPQIDGAADPASYQYDTTDYARLPTKDLNVDLDVQANYMSHLPPSQEPSFSYPDPDPSTNTAAEFTFFDPYNNDEDTYTEQPVYIPPSYLAHLPQPPRHLFQPTPSRPPPPPPHLRPHTPEYLLFPPTAASSTKKIWPRPPTPIEGYRQFTFVRDRISLQLSAKRRTEIDLETGEYRYSMDSQETNRGYKMDGTRIRTDERFFRKKRMTRKVLAKMELERIEEEERRKREELHEAIRPEYGDMFRKFREGGEGTYAVGSSARINSCSCGNGGSAQ